MLGETNDASQTENETTRDSHALISTRSFKDFLLKPELLRAITECGFEHPSEVQQESIPQAILGTDIICQAKSGMGKTTIFILATIQQLEPIDGRISVIVLCHTRELAFSISREYERFCKYMPAAKVSSFYGGVTIKIHEDILKSNCPHIVVGTPGRILALAKSKALNLHYVKHFIIDQCDTLLESLDIRRDVQEIFKMTPHEKQVFMCSSSLKKEILPLCKKFTRDPMELIYTDNVSKLTLHGLRQYYIKLHEDEKNQKLIDLLGKLEFNQAVIFVKSVSRCNALCQLLIKENFPAIEIHQEMTQEQRLTCYKEFQDFQKRILITTNLLQGSMNIQHVNIVLNYDIPKDTDTYLYRVGHIGYSGEKALAITFISDESDAAILNEIQRRFEIYITEIPNEIDVATYLKKMLII